MEKKCTECEKVFVATSNRITCSEECKKTRVNKRWLRENNISEVSIKGKRNGVTRRLNKQIAIEVNNCSLDCLLKEFGDIE